MPCHNEPSKIHAMLALLYSLSLCIHYVGPFQSLLGSSVHACTRPCHASQFRRAVVLGHGEQAQDQPTGQVGPPAGAPLAIWLYASVYYAR